MLNINLLSNVAENYLSKFDNVNKINATEATLISINESITELEQLKEIMKQQHGELSVANILSICLSISNQSKDIKELNLHLKHHKQI